MPGCSCAPGLDPLSHSLVLTTVGLLDGCRVGVSSSNLGGRWKYLAFPLLDDNGHGMMEEKGSEGGMGKESSSCVMYSKGRRTGTVSNTVLALKWH